MELCYCIKDLWQPVRGIQNFFCVPVFKGFIGFLFPNIAEATKITKFIFNINEITKEKLSEMNEKLKKEEEELKKLKKLEKEKGTVKGAFKDFFGLSK